MFENFTPVSAALGGAALGTGAAMVLLGQGRIAGVSGIWGGLLRPVEGEVAWRVAFVLGLLAGGVALAAFAPGLVAVPAHRSLGAVAVAGLMVGVGTRLGNGCTSGHGVCGIARGSPRSLAAVATFMAVAAAVATAIGAWGVR